MTKRLLLSSITSGSRLHLITENFPKTFGQCNVWQSLGFSKEWSNVRRLEACYAATDGGDKKTLVGVRGCIADKVVNIGADGVNTTLHGGYGIALSLYANAYAHLGTKVEARCASCATTVHAFEVAAKYKDFVFLECADAFGGNARIVHNLYV